MGRWFAGCVAIGMMIGEARGIVAAKPPGNCRQIELAGEVRSGEEWKSPIGQGWVFRLVPIQPGPPSANYSGWDLVIDRDPPAGFPDALLLATPPYGSINEREVGTTFRVRAQDAIGWNPRSFRFFTDPWAFRRGQQLFSGAQQAGSAPARALMELVRTAKGSGEFRILDARLTPGTGDAAPFAEAWAVQSAHTPHSVDAVAKGPSTPLGTLNDLRFSITFWLPGAWQSAGGLPAAPVACPAQ